MFIDGHYNPDTVCIIALPALINAASYLKKLITGVVITHMRITWHKFVKKRKLIYHRLPFACWTHNEFSSAWRISDRKKRNHPEMGINQRFMRWWLEVKTLSGWWFQPLWKIWKSVGMLIPNMWKIKKMFQTTNQSLVCNHSLSWSTCNFHQQVNSGVAFVGISKLLLPMVNQQT